MRYVPPGTGGICVGLGLFLLVRYIADKRTPQGGPFTFEPGGVRGTFEPRLANYIRAVEYLLGLATGSIVLLVGSSALHATGTLPWAFASPLIVLGFCVVYGGWGIAARILRHIIRTYYRTRFETSTTQ